MHVSKALRNWMANRDVMLLAFSPVRESYLVFKIKLSLKLAFIFGCVAATLSQGGFSLHLVVNGFNLVYRV